MRRLLAVFVCGCVALIAACRAGETFTIADFEKGTDGFGGSIERDRSVAKLGRASGVMKADFTKKGEWIAATRKFRELDRDFEEVRFWIRSSESNGITFRLVDAAGETHQQRPVFEPDGEWHPITIRSFDTGRGHQCWGGDGNGKWDPPAKSVSFILEKGTLKGPRGDVWIDAVEATLDPERIVPEFRLGRTAPLGNVFLTTEEVAIPIETKGDALRWKITDFWRETVAEGTETVVQGSAVIRPPFRKKGYFLVKVSVEKNGRPLAERYTSFAVIPPCTVRNRDESPFGVMTHFAQGMDVDIFGLFVKAGIVSIRDEHYWAQVEKRRGVYEFPEKSDRYMRAARKHGIDPLVAMTFANDLHDDGLTPYTSAGCDAYGRYGQAILKRYGRQIRWLEIWNEYNGTWCEGPCAEDRPRYYTQMLRHAYERIKAVRPDVKVLGCATVLIPMPYLEGVFRHGGLKYMDAVVIHPYRGRPEGVEKEVAELEALIRKYNDGRDKPIWVTETGRHDTSEFAWEKGKGMYEKGRGRIARYLVRQYALLLTRNVQKIYWYLCRDHMNFRSMGLVRHADDKMGRYAVAPAYVAYATLTRQLDGARFVRREAVREYTRARVYLFSNRGEEVRVSWATHPSEIEMSTSGPLTLVDMMGEEKALRPDGGTVRLSLDRSPVYVKGEVQEVIEIVTGPKVLADAGEDYSKTQGRNSWYYGYYDGDGRGEGDGRAPSGPYTDDDFAPMEQKETVWGYKWKGPAKYLELSRGGGHPEIIAGRQAWAVRRWKSTVEGKVRIRGSYRRGRKGQDGSEGVVLVGGRQVFKRGVGGSMFPDRVELDLVVEVEEATLVDFAVTPGPRSELMYDATGFEARITETE